MPLLLFDKINSFSIHDLLVCTFLPRKLKNSIEMDKCSYGVKIIKISAVF